MLPFDKEDFSLKVCSSKLDPFFQKRDTFPLMWADIENLDAFFLHIFVTAQIHTIISYRLEIKSIKAD